MILKVNGEEQEVATGTTVDALLDRLGLPDPAGVAVAVNLDVVPRTEREIRVLAEGDRVDIVTAVGGG